jgi:hypothetical protein
MGFSDKLSAGLDTVAKSAQKAFEQGKVRVDQLQLERQLDAAARRLGYIEFDASQGRPVDQAAKQDLLTEMARLETELHSGFAEAGAGQPAAGAAEPGGAEAEPVYSAPVGSDIAEAERISQAASAAGVQPGTPDAAPEPSAPESGDAPDATPPLP